MYQKGANQGDATGEYNIGSFCLYGLGVAKDLDRALFWLDKAAAQGNVEAENDLGWIYQRGLGVKQDNVQAIA